jgi:ATP-binding cassette, subfamily B, bacterial CvaB/MchF/RaxB
MDEGTANLDQDTEAAILQNLRSLGITTIHAAHRAQVVNDATQVLHLHPSKPEHD